jgi:peroxiredoxin
MQSMSTRIFNFALYTALAACCVVVLLLVQQNRDLKEQLYTVSPAAAGGLHVGDRLPELAVREIDGAASRLQFGPDTDTVIMLFTTTCSTCTTNLDNWRQLYAQQGDSYQFVAISADQPEATRTYAERNALPFRVVLPEDPAFFGSMYGVDRVPVTIVAGPDGRVKEIRQGLLEEPSAAADLPALGAP